MKITINGSAKELTELAIALSCMESEEKKPYFPPLLTELAEAELRRHLDISVLRNSAVKRHHNSVPPNRKVKFAD